MPSSRSQTPPSGSASPHMRVVAIGASAGGLEALTAILRGLPTDLNMAFVLLQHLDPKRHSILPELLAKATRIPVLEAKHSMRLEPNRVYVMPSNVDISLADGHFGLLPRSTGLKPHLPINNFMRSLAEVHKSQSIGVILSGTATDGTDGARAIREAGGVTFAQDPSTAKFSGMPQNAIDSGCIDFILTPQKIAAELVRMARHPKLRKKAAMKPVKQQSDEEIFNSILNLVSNSQSADFREYKPNTIRRRTQQRIAALGISSLTGYLNYLGKHPDEVARLSHHILIPVTEFFRNPEVFDDLVKTVYPTLVEAKEQTSIRVWVVACSSGEEVYSLAITLLEYLGAKASSLRVQIFGTDINEKGIARAREGVYPEKTLKYVSEERIARFFTKVAEGYRVNKSVRDLCIFARQDVTTDPPFSNIDLISCRNFLIYIQPDLQEKIISTLHYALKSSGFLLLGNAESAAPYPLLFVPLNKKNKIYSKKVVLLRQQRPFNRGQNLIRVGALPPIELPPVSRAKQSEAQMQQAADHIVLKEHAPPGVIVNEAMDILQFRGRTSPYLEPASGRANLNLLNMVREDLSIPLRSALATARKKAAEVKKKNIAFEYNGKKRQVNLSVISLDKLPAGTERNYLILFEDATPAITKQDKKTQSLPLKPGDLPRKRLLEQKRELQAARALLKEHLAAQEALREDFQSANEELLSANEELQSSNEEMETSKEELESANEELTTVNDELNSSNSALHVMGNDLKNLLDSTVIPIVMVDSGLCIRSMTPMAEKVFNVLPSDIGRPLTDIRPDFDIELKPLLAAALRDIVTLEREVQDQQGHWYRLQIRPYKTLENRIDGAVLVLVDIHAMKMRNQVLVDAAEFTTSIISTMPEPVLVLDAELRVLMANESYYNTFTVAPETTLNQFVYRLGDGQWDTSDLRMLLEEVLPQHKEFTNHELVHNFAGIGVKSFALSGRYMEQGPNTAPRILLALADVTQRKKTELALIQAEKLAIASRLAASVAHEINNPLEAITNLLFLASTSDNAASVKLFIDQALDELGRVAHITQQTLKFYRQSTSPTSVQLFELLDSLLALYHGKLLANNINVRRDYRDAPPILSLDGDLRQIFANIIANAIDAMKSGGSLVLRVSASPDWRNQVKPGVRITIADAGIGMNMETRRRMYEPFFTTKNGTGTGLGMWVSAQLIERLQGDLRVRSTDRTGRSGTTFSLFLPTEASA